jgi:hypothetical protein
MRKATIEVLMGAACRRPSCVRAGVLSNSRTTCGHQQDADECQREPLIPIQLYRHRTL